MEKQNMRHRTWYTDINQIQETKNQIQEHNTNRNHDSNFWLVHSVATITMSSSPVARGHSTGTSWNPLILYFKVQFLFTFMEQLYLWFTARVCVVIRYLEQIWMFNHHLCQLSLCHICSCHHGQLLGKSFCKYISQNGYDRHLKFTDGG